MQFGDILYKLYYGSSTNFRFCETILKKKIVHSHKIKGLRQTFRSIEFRLLEV